MKVEPLKLHSYSYDQILHLCARRFEIMQNWPADVKRTISKEEDVQAVATLTEGEGNVDFAFGHCVHAGVQRLFLDSNLDAAIWEAFRAWDIHLLNTHKSKSFWTAIDAIHKAQVLVQNIKDEGWEVFTVKGKPSIELNFLIHLVKGHKYQGHIDIILRHKQTGEYKVFEIKTTVFVNVDEAMYANSAQPLGYSVIMDTIAPNQVNYEVTYLIWSEAKSGRQWHVMPFMKSRTAKAEWIRDVMSDVDIVEKYKAEGYFPKRGEACYAFFRRCPYFGTCNLPLKALIPGYGQGEKEKDTGKEEYRGQGEEYDFVFTLEALITNQLDIAEM